MPQVALLRRALCAYVYLQALIGQANGPLGRAVCSLPTPPQTHPFLTRKHYDVSVPRAKVCPPSISTSHNQPGAQSVC